MKVQTAKHMVRLQEWARQIQECQQSGQSVKQWCEEQGVNRKTYYSRLRVLQEEMLDERERKGGIQKFISGDMGRIQQNAEWGPAPQIVSRPDRNEQAPVFAALPVPRVREAAVTVRIGEYAVDIYFEADEKIVGQVLRAVIQL